MRTDGGLQRAAAVLLQTALVVGLLVGCVVAPRPPHGIQDLPHVASQAPSKEMEPSPHVSVARETIWAQ